MKSDPHCIFCKIIAQKIPSLRIYEDQEVFAFLDIGPLSPGHALVIPKGHWATLDQMPDDAGAAIGRVLPRLSRAIKAATGIHDWNILQNNGRAAHQVVDHVHFHIIPKPPAPGSGGLGITWPAGKLEMAEGKGLRERISDGMH